MLKRFFRCSALFPTLLFILGMSSCERINDSTELEDFDEAQDFLFFQHASWMPIQMVEHINSTGSTLGLNGILMDSLSTQLRSQYSIIDSTYLDNNGIEYILTFNSLNTTAYNPYQHFTSYNFDGQISVQVDQNYREISSKSKIEIPETKPLIINYPQFGKIKMHGIIELERIAANTIKINYTNFKMEYDSEVYRWDADLEYHWLGGASTDGLYNDKIELKGQGVLEEADDSYEKSEFHILSNLLKSFEPGCSDYFQTGTLKLLTHEDHFTIDFDPFKNGSCSPVVRISNSKGELEVFGP